MKKVEIRKIKRNLYKHGNAIMYTVIFALASIITIAAATNRTDKVLYVDESSPVLAEQESVALENTESNKVAATDAESDTVPNVTSNEAEPEVTTVVEETTEPATTPIAALQAKITADTLKVRAETSTEAEVLGMVDMDDLFEVISQTDEWIEINYNGRGGYISAEFAEIVE